MHIYTRIKNKELYASSKQHNMENLNTVKNGKSKQENLQEKGTVEYKRKQEKTNEKRNIQEKTNEKEMTNQYGEKKNDQLKENVLWSDITDSEFYNENFEENRFNFVGGGSSKDNYNGNNDFIIKKIYKFLDLYNEFKKEKNENDKHIIKLLSSSIDFITHAISQCKYSNVQNKNLVNVYFKNNKNINIKGDKSKYGLLVGIQGKTIKSIKTRYPGININIPSKDEITNEIVVNGNNVFDTMCDILYVIKP